MATKQKQYTLYLDESETNNNGSNPHFCIAGVIIRDKEYDNVEKEMNNLKQKIWKDLSEPQGVILHQKNIIEAKKGKLDIIKYPEYERFRAKQFRKYFYSEFAKIFDGGQLAVIGSSLNVDYMEKCYNVLKPVPRGQTAEYRNETNKYLIALQLLLENYCHFLTVHNAKGRIVYESISEIDDERLCSKFYQIKLMGSMYMTKSAMENHLIGINFIKKEENNIGLQVADFVPYAFAREHAGFEQMDKEDRWLRKLKYYRYGKRTGEQNRYGVKYMP